VMKMLYPIAAALLLGTSSPALAGHHEMATIVDAAVASPQHETLVAAVKAAELVDALSGSGPLTVFAPTDAAFAKLPDGTVQTLLKPENRTTLQAVLTYHVVPGQLTAADLVSKIGENGGMATLPTLEGSTLTARLDDGKVTITDENGGVATVIAADLSASNGLIHVTDAVSLPD
jgi:uncharacterized surface protein with fasciclin (FAS1) repeats